MIILDNFLGYLLALNEVGGVLFVDAVHWSELEFLLDGKLKKPL